MWRSFQKGKERAGELGRQGLVPDRAEPDRGQESSWKMNDFTIKSPFENPEVRGGKLFAVDVRLSYCPPLLW